MEQERENYHYDSANAAIWQATKEPPITQDRLCRIHDKRGEKVNHKLDSQQLSWKDQVFISKLKSGHHPGQKYWLHNIVRGHDTVSWKHAMLEETVEKIMGECPQSHHHANQLPKSYQIATNPLKALELWELRKAKPDIPGTSQLGQPSAQLLAQQQQQQ